MRDELELADLVGAAGLRRGFPRVTCMWGGTSHTASRHPSALVTVAREDYSGRQVVEGSQGRDLVIVYHMSFYPYTPSWVYHSNSLPIPIFVSQERLQMQGKTGIDTSCFQHAEVIFRLHTGCAKTLAYFVQLLQSTLRLALLHSSLSLAVMVAKEVIHDVIKV